MSEFLDVARLLLAREKRPMSAKELTDIAVREGRFTDNIAGRTPHQTMKSKLSVEIRRMGPQSEFVRTAPGRFSLRTYVEPGAIYLAPPLRPPAPAERVLGLSRVWVSSHVQRQGISRGWRKVVARAIAENAFDYLPRPLAEVREDFKHIVTYVLVTKAGQLLAFKRGSFTNAEQFLRGAQCVGFGGHVSLADRTLFSAADAGISESITRELNEELKLPYADRTRLGRGEGLAILGIINDDSSPTGRRHLGVVAQYEVSSDASWERPERNEKSITQLRWLDLNTSRVSLWEFEYWSQLCLTAFFADYVQQLPAYRLVRREPFVPPHVLCVIGGVGSGKTSVTTVLRDGYRYREVNSGRILARLLGIRPVDEKSRVRFQRLANSFITRERGPLRLAKAVTDAVTKLNTPRVLVDGIRQPATLANLRELVANRVAVLYVHTPPHVAYDFYMKRSGLSLTMEEFLERRNAPVEADVESLISSADAVIYNWYGIRRLSGAVRELMGVLGISHG